MPDTADPVLRIVPTVRLVPPPSIWSTERWYVMNIAARREILLGSAAAQVLLNFLRAGPAGERLEELHRSAGLEPDAGRLIVEQLVAEGLLTPDGDDSRLEETERRWRDAGWQAAFDHHLLTYDYPYLNYSESEAPAIDKSIMEKFAAESFDVNRYKEYAGSLTVPVVQTAEALECLTRPFGEAWDRRNASESLPVATCDKLTTMISSSFGQLRSRRIRSSVPRAPLVRKTSPSGGSRHPVECYVLARKVLGLAPGTYHFAVRTSELERIGDLPGEDELRPILQGLWRAPFDPAAFVVVTGLWERNMYRYREPRTFRTVFMDAGHAAATMELCGQALDLPVFWQHGVDDIAVHGLLGLQKEGLDEGVLYAAAVGRAATGLF
jgi:SagB-type dehydrogenase family enzyme